MMTNRGVDANHRLLLGELRRQQTKENRTENMIGDCESITWPAFDTVTMCEKLYLHINTNGGVVDCEWYSVLDIFLDLCEAVGKQ